jgi:hypothetical protein
MYLVTKRLWRDVLLIGAVALAIVAALAAFAPTVSAHHGDFYSSADCYSWTVGATYTGDNDRRVDVDVTVNGEHIVISDTGYDTGDTLFERTGTGSVDAQGTIKVYYNRHGSWRLESENSLDFHFDFETCVPESTPVASPSPEAQQVSPSPQPPSSPPAASGAATATPQPEVLSAVLTAARGPTSLPNTGGEPSGTSSEVIALLAGGLALMSGGATIAFAAARHRRR